MGNGTNATGVSALAKGTGFLPGGAGGLPAGHGALDPGFVNISVWRQEECVVTFHLAVRDAARFATFLVEGLGDATSALLRPSGGDRLRPVPPPTGVGARGARRAALDPLRRRLAAWVSPAQPPGPPR